MVPSLCYYLEQLSCCLDSAVNRLLPKSWRDDKNDLRDTLIQEGWGRFPLFLWLITYCVDVLIAGWLIEISKWSETLGQLSQNLFKGPSSPLALSQADVKDQDSLKLGQLLVALELIGNEEVTAVLDVQSQGDERQFGAILVAQTPISKSLVEFIESNRRRQSRLSISLSIDVRSGLAFLVLMLTALIGISVFTSESKVMIDLLRVLKLQINVLAIAAAWLIAEFETVSRQFKEFNVNYALYWRLLGIGLYGAFLGQLLPIEQLFSHSSIIQYLSFVLPIAAVAIYFPVFVEISNCIHLSKISRGHQFIGGLLVAFVLYIGGCFLNSIVVGEPLQILGLAMVLAVSLVYINTRAKEAGVSLQYNP